MNIKVFWASYSTLEWADCKHFGQTHVIHLQLLCLLILKVDGTCACYDDLGQLFQGHIYIAMIVSNLCTETILWKVQYQSLLHEAILDQSDKVCNIY